MDGSLSPSRQSGSGSRRAPFFCAWVLGVLTLALYWPVSGHDYIDFDDGLYVFRNPIVLRGWTWEGVQWAFARMHGQGTYWHPLTWLSHMLDVQWFGNNPGAFHLESVLIHATNGILLFFLLQRWTRKSWTSFLLSLIFLLHPLQADTVAWIAERKNLLSTLFALGTLLAWSRFRFNSRRLDYGIALLLFALGLMCKPSIVPLPFLLLLLEAWPFRSIPLLHFSMNEVRALTRRAAAQIPFFVLAAASCAVTIRAHAAMGITNETSGLSFAARLANALVSYGRYLKKFFWPNDLAVFYPHPLHWPAWTVAAVALLLLAITWLAWRDRQAAPARLVGWFWFAGMLVPVLGLQQAGEQAMADRFIYFPMIGILIAFSPTLEIWEDRFRWGGRTLLLTAAIAAPLLFATHRQLGFWRNTLTVFEHAVDVTAKNHIAHNNLAYHYSLAGNFAKARAHAEAALQIKPTMPEAHYQLGTFLLRDGKPNDALLHLRAAVQQSPDWPPALIALADLLQDLGRDSEAIPLYEKYLAARPDSPHGYFHYATSLWRAERRSDAAAAWGRSRTLDAMEFRREISALGARDPALAEMVLKETRAP